MLKPEIYIEGQRLDLYDDENISVVSSVQNLEDISKTFNDFSQSFTVPASDTNNGIFQHYYNASVNDGFDARIRHTAHIDIQATPFKVGTIRLESCLIKNNIPQHYKITFFGQLIDLKETIGDDYLSALDLTAYDLDYTPANVKTGLVSGFSTADYIFPLISTKRQWFFNSNVASVTYTDTLSNIAWNASGTDHGIEWASLRPALKVMRIIEAIETKYSITFSRDFFGTAYFDTLYLWLTNQTSEEALKQKTRITNYGTVNVYQPAIGSYDNSTGAYTPTTSGAPKLRQIIFDTDTTDGILYTIQLMNGSTVLDEKTGTGNLRIDKNFPGGFSPGASIYGRIITTTSKLIDQAYFEIDELSDDQVLDATKLSFTLSGSTALTAEFIPKIKILDFLKSIMKMTNMIVVPNSATDFKMQTLDAWYEEGATYDISAFVDTEQITVKRGKIFKEISFNFQEPQTILAEQFEKTNATAYGDLETKIKSANDTTLDGGEFPIEVDFEQMIYEKLLNLNDDSDTNVVYGLSLDAGLASVTPEPHLFFAIQRDISGNSLSFVDDTGTQSQLNTNVYMPAHTESDTMAYSTCFGSEINEHTGALITNSLFRLYYEDYITDMFSIKRRGYDLKTQLPLWLLNQLNLNDKLIIGTDRYLINQLTVNVTTQEVQMELLNDIYNVDTDVVIDEESPVDPTPEPVDPTVGVSVSIDSISYATHLLACAGSPNTIKYSTIGGIPALGTILYNEIGLTTLFDGDSKWWKISDSYVIQVLSTGRVVNIYLCGVGFP